MTYIYGHYDEAGSLLYVGLTGDVMKRSSQHRRTAAWWPLVTSVEVLDELPYEEARKRERELIVKLSPPYNKVYSEEWRKAMYDPSFESVPGFSDEAIAQIRAAFRGPALGGAT